MTMPSLSAATSALPVTEPDQPTQQTQTEQMSDDLRALRALRLMLESRLITPPEYARRLESFRKRLEIGSQDEQINTAG